MQVEARSVLTVILKGESWRTHEGEDMFEMREVKRAVTARF